MKDIRMGDVTDFRNFMGAVIDQKAFTKISGYLDDQLAAELIEAGAKALIRKPHSPEMVVRNVRELLLENRV